MSNVFTDIRDLHAAICPAQIQDLPAINPVHKQLRIDLIQEEVLHELLPALAVDDLVGIADGCIDAIVVILGTMLAYGLPMQALWDEVHRTNMAKADGPMREDGKRLKPPGWTPPDIAGIIRRAELHALRERGL